MTRFILLLRGINVNRRRLDMAALRASARAAGYADCATYIQSGNLVFSGAGDAAAAEAAIEALIARDFAMSVEAIARSAADFARIAAANPFPDADAKALHLCLSKRPLAAGAAEALQARAAHGERVAVAGEALWIDFVGGVGNSKLTPAAIDKAAGSTVTARNWNTVQKLLAMAGEQGGKE